MAISFLAQHMPLCPLQGFHSSLPSTAHSPQPTGLVFFIKKANSSTSTQCLLLTAIQKHSQFATLHPEEKDPGGMLGPKERTQKSSVQAFSKCSPETSSIGITRELTRNTHFGTRAAPLLASQYLHRQDLSAITTLKVWSLPKGCNSRGDLGGTLQTASVSFRSEHSSGQHAALGARVGRKDPIFQALGVSECLFPITAVETKRQVAVAVALPRPK